MNPVSHDAAGKEPSECRIAKALLTTKGTESREVLSDGVNGRARHLWIFGYSGQVVAYELSEERLRTEPVEPVRVGKLPRETIKTKFERVFGNEMINGGLIRYPYCIATNRRLHVPFRLRVRIDLHHVQRRACP